MAAYLADRVAQYSPTTGTGSMTLGASLNGHKTFASAFGSDACYYGIVDPVTGDWETGMGAVAGGVLARTTPSASSNGGARVAFGAGNKIVYNDIPAEMVFDIAMGDARYLRLDGSVPFTGNLLFGNVTTGARISLPLSDNTGFFAIQHGADPDIPRHHVRFTMSGSGGGDGLLAIQSGAGNYLLFDPLNRTISADGAMKIGGSGPVTIDSPLTVTGVISGSWAIGGASLNSSGDATIGNNAYVGNLLQAANLLGLNGSLELRGATTTADRTVLFSDLDGSERARVYSEGDDDSLHIRVRIANVTRAELVMGSDGAIETAAGYWKGMTFGSQVAGARNDLSRHLRLHEDGYGIAITGSSLNLNLNTNARAYFVYADGSIIAQVDQPGADVPSGKTLVTVEKGDPRYRNASNLNDGTVPVTRLPTTNAERDRIMALIAAAPLGAVGSTEMLMRATKGTTITKGNVMSGANLRYAGIAADGGDWASAVESSDNTAPAGAWIALASIAGKTNAYSIGIFRRVN